MSSFIKCNVCESRNCPYDDKAVERMGGSLSCKGYEPPREFKLPLLVHLMSKKDATPIHDLLQSFGFKIMEREEYPYFFLTTKG